MTVSCAIVVGLTAQWAAEVSEATIVDRLGDSADALDQLTRALIAGS